MLFSEMPLHHCVAALDTGFVLTEVPARIRIYGSGGRTNPPRTCSVMAVGTGGNAWQVSLDLPSCPRWSGEVPCMASTHPGSSPRRGHTANGTITQLHVPAGAWSSEPLQPPEWLLGAVEDSPHFRATIRASHHSKHTNPPAHSVSLLYRLLFCW